MSKSIKNYFIVAAMAAIVLCVGCQKNNSDIDETKAQVSPAVWERSESETRTYNVMAKEHADELRKNESDWLTDGKLDSSKYSTESGEPYRVQMLMPESVAKKLDTRELLDFCLQHSSVKEFTLFNSWEEGFDNVVNVINVFEHTSFGKVKRKQQKSSIHAGLRRDGSRSDTSLSDGQRPEITIA